MPDHTATLPRVTSPQDQLPALRTAVPGPRSRELAARLARVESRNVTCLTPEPIFWQSARGANVWDVDGNRYRRPRARRSASRTSGHAHPRVARAVAEQADTLLHGMGDVHPSAVKVELLEALASRFPGGGTARAVLGSSGSDAVEIALKTAALATGRAGRGRVRGRLSRPRGRGARRDPPGRLPRAVRGAGSPARRRSRASATRRMCGAPRRSAERPSVR